MTDYYVKSTTGADVNSGLTWALAKATLAGAAAVATAAGDRVFISQAHAESLNSNTGYGSTGTDNNPVRWFCANDATGEPPTANATTAVVQTISPVNSVIIGHGSYYGITFEIGTGAATNINVSNAVAANTRFELCNLKLNTTGGSAKFTFGNAGGGGLKHFVNCGWKFAAAAAVITLVGCKFHIQGGSILAGSATPNNLFSNPTAGTGHFILIEDFDFSNFGTGFSFFGNTLGPNWVIIIRNCKLPSGWTGGLVNPLTLTIVGTRVSMYNSGSAAARYNRWIEDFAGTIRDETSFVRTGGNPTTIKMTSNAKCLAGQPTTALKSDELVKFNTLVGAPITVSVQVLTDSATPTTNAQAWLEVEYLSAAGSPLGAHISDGLQAPLDAPTTQDAGATWATGAMANPDPRKLSVTFTPQRAGYVHAKVHWNKPSAVLYVDETLTIV